jgi:hypothetical protein
MRRLVTAVTSLAVIGLAFYGLVVQVERRLIQPV